jgi:dihydrofolate reductase
MRVYIRRINMQAILAVGDNNEFGLKGGLPWGHNAIDLSHFKEKTLGKTLLCGKSTYNSLPPSVFKGRFVKMVKRGDYIFEGDTSNSIIIGGTSLLTLENLELCDTIWITRIKGTFKADTYLEWNKRLSFYMFIERHNEVIYEDDSITITESRRQSNE